MELNGSNHDSCHTIVPHLSGLKRKNENGNDEEQIEAGIKRVALEDEYTPTLNNKYKDSKDSHSHETNREVGNTDSTDSLQEDTESSRERTEELKDDFISNYAHIRMLCPIKEASIVVGPKGETIQHIKSVTSTKINVSANLRDVPERVIYVRGSIKNVATAYKMISDYLINENSKRTTSNNTNSEKSSTSDNEREGKQETLNENSTEKQSIEEKGHGTKVTAMVHILIPNHLMGYVIGKNGSSLKEIEEISKSNLRASPYQLLPSNDRILRVDGSSESIGIVVERVAQIFDNNKEKFKHKKTIFYQPAPIYSVLGNPSLLPHNKSINSFSSPGHTSTSFSNNKLPLEDAPLNMIFPPVNMPQIFPLPRAIPIQPGFPHQIYNANFPVDVNSIYTPESVAKATSFIPNVNIPNVKIFTGPLINQPINIVKQEIFIDENYVGHIIGKAGKHINSIKESTGCSIIFDKPNKNIYQRRLTIEGSGMGIQAAIMLINNKIATDIANKNSNKRP